MDQPAGSPTRGAGAKSPPTLLRSLQIVFGALVAGVVGTTAVMVFLVASAEEPAGDSTALAVGATAVGAILIIVSLRVRPELDTTDETSLARSYQSRTIIGTGIAEAAMLLALVAFFLGHDWWMLGVVVGFIVVGFVPHTPNRASIERAQTEIMARGSGLSLADSLGRSASSIANR